MAQVREKAAASLLKAAEDGQPLGGVRRWTGTAKEGRAFDRDDAEDADWRRHAHTHTHFWGVGPGRVLDLLWLDFPKNEPPTGKMFLFSITPSFSRCPAPV